MATNPIAAAFLQVKGNVSSEARKAVAEWSKLMCQTQYFGNNLVQRLTAVEMTVTGDQEGSSWKQACMVFDLDVTEGLSFMLL
jgi:hypothetical protein